jgi:hypothetical protein
LDLDNDMDDRGQRKRNRKGNGRLESKFAVGKRRRRRRRIFRYMVME